MKLTKSKLKQIIKEELERGLNEASQPWVMAYINNINKLLKKANDAGAITNQERYGAYEQLRDFQDTLGKALGKVADEAPQDFYAYVEIPYEGGMIIEGDSAEELREDAPHYGKLKVIFTANIIEGKF
jgi:hypothetical protein